MYIRTLLRDVAREYARDRAISMAFDTLAYKCRRDKQRKQSIMKQRQRRLRRDRRLFS